MKKIKLNFLLMLLSMLGFSQMALAVNESEPNDLWNQADVITLGATGTGACPATGDVDWWRITSTVDGQLTVNFTSTNGVYLYCQIFDTLGVIGVSGAIYTNGSNVINVDGLAAGTYYIRFFAYNASESPTYSFVPTWTTPTQTIDVEPNDKKSQAKTLPLNGSVTGHISYYYNNKRDTTDWWKVTTNKDGQLFFTLTCNNGNYVYAQLYDNDGVTFLAGSYTNGTATYNFDGLAVGTYYIAVFAYSVGSHAPYTLSNSFVLPPVIIDSEPNGTPAQAIVNLLPGDSTVGHVSYYYNQYRDTTDWYKVTTTLDGQLNYSISSLNGNYVFLQLYDNDGVTLLGGSYTNGTTIWSTDGLAAGTYYLAVFAYSINAHVPYQVKVTQTLPSVTIDAEPNGTKSSAKTINPNDSITGHVSYYYKNERDTIDYRKVTITSNGRLDWTISSQNGNYIYALLYDNNATTYLGGSYTNGTTTFSSDGLAPGTYYLLLSAYSINSNVPYYLKTKFTPVGNDLEPNGTYATAKPLNLNDSLNGNISYYYNNVRDTTDWFALTTTNDGQLNVKLYSLNGNYVYLTVYDNNGSTVLYQTYSNTVVSYSRNDLAKGTYYVRVEAYYLGSFAPYALVNSLVNNNANDPEPNNYAKTSGKINGYSTRTGNTNYYYNGANDVADWWKLGYYALGNLDITVTKVQHSFDANYPDILYRLYKDTSLAPLDSVQLTGANLVYTHSYTAFGAGTFYIRITPLNNTFGGYSIKPNFKDTTSQTVTLTSKVEGTTCGVGALNYFITRGKPPYSVQLFKDGVATGAPVNTSDTAKFTSLDAGYYTATVRSTTAATYVVTSAYATVVPKVVGLATSSVTTASAILKWTGLPCADGYKLQWRLKGAPTWTNTIFQLAGATQDTITGLVASTQYQFRIYAYTLYPTVKYYGLVSSTKTFTTPAIRLADANAGDISVSELEVYPNPVVDRLNFNVDDASPVTNIAISNTLGQTLKTINNVVDLSQSIDVSSLHQGIYFITIKTATSTYTSRFVKE